jgi:hypothetical protein
MAQATKLDLRRELKALYGPPAGRPVLVDVPELSFLMVDSHGDPNLSQDYRDAVQALFTVSYAVRLALLHCANPGRAEAATSARDQTAKASSSNATATRRFAGSSTASS